MSLWEGGEGKGSRRKREGEGKGKGVWISGSLSSVFTLSSLNVKCYIVNNLYIVNKLVNHVVHVITGSAFRERGLKPFCPVT